LPTSLVPADDAWPLRDYPAHGPDRDDPFVWTYEPLYDRTLEQASSEGMRVLMAGDRGDDLIGNWVFDGLGLLRAGEVRALLQDLPLAGGIRAGAKRDVLLPALMATGLPGLPPALGRRLSTSVAPTRTSPWLRPEFARHVGLPGRPDPPRPSGKDFARWTRHRSIFAPVSLRTAVHRERRRARFGLGYSDPYSDRRLVELVTAFPQWRVQRRSRPKALARAAMRGLVPEPARVRMGQTTPVRLFERGMKDHERHRLLDLVTGMHAAKRGWVDEAAVRQSVERYLRDEPQDAEFWWPVTLEMWLRAFWSDV